jgi:arginase family enzyme
VNDNEEVKQFEGKRVKVVGSPAPFGWTVKFTTPDNRVLKTSNVFGVDTVEVVQPACDAQQSSASGGQ